MFRTALLSLLFAASFAPRCRHHRGETQRPRSCCRRASPSKSRRGRISKLPRPIVAAFDEKGRLYVCDSSGSNEDGDSA
ncbi:MAG: hypothetical protein U0792_03900 [Gemmataceae bacterium]